MSASIGHQGGWQRPRNREVEVVERDRDVLRRVVLAVDSVGNVGRICECLESVRAQPAGMRIDRHS